MKTLHIHCGDSSANTLKGSSIEGDILVWREIYTEGPVLGQLSQQEFLTKRAKFISESTGMSYEKVFNASTERYNQLAAAKQYDEVILWFDACMFDQTIMIHLLEQCWKQEWDKTKLSLICIGEFPGLKKFCGLGELTTDQLASLMDQRHEVTREVANLARKAWLAYTSRSPHAINKIISSDCSALPYLKDALIRHAQQYPSIKNGLNRLQNQVLETIASGNNNLIKIFNTVSEMEERPYFGDITLWRVIQDLSEGEEPALTISDSPLTELLIVNPKTYKAPSSEKLNKWKVELTKTGESLLKGDVNYIELNGIDSWLGGVHLEGNIIRWRWDSDASKLQHFPSFERLSKQEIVAHPLRRCEGNVHFIDSSKDISKAIETLESETVIGFDTETRPAFKKGEFYPPALLQLAGSNDTYVFQLKQLKLSELFNKILANPNIIKAGVAPKDDVKELSELSFFEPSNFIDLSKMAKNIGINNFGLRGMAASVLGFRISKACQRSNWGSKDLNNAQINYAATDAWVGRELYLKLKEMGK